MSKWEDVGSGVMLWNPTVEVKTGGVGRSSSRARTTTDEMEERKRGSGRAASSEPNLPSVDSIEENLRTKQLIYEELFHTLEKPPDSETPLPTSQIVTASLPSAKDNVVTPLKSFVIPSSSLPSSPGSEQLITTSISISTTTQSTKTDSDSDRTDFLVFADSPCPRPVSSMQRERRSTGRTSHHFRKSVASKREVSVRRKLDFSTSKATKKSSSAQTSGKMDRPPEYSPRHHWTDKQHEFLCVLWRWYQRDVRRFACIFNERFGLNLEQRRVTTRFENYLRLFGPSAFKVYDSVFATPFDDPQDTYGSVRRHIERLARGTLSRLQFENISPAGSARTAKSRQTRRLYKSLVKKASQQNPLEASRQLCQEDFHSTHQSFGHATIRTEAEFDSSEYFTDSEGVTCTSFTSDEALETSFQDPERPSLAFRVYDASAKGLVSADGSIVSEGLVLWKGPMPPAPNGQIVEVLLNNHLSMSRGGTSFYLSVSVSLLQLFNRASNLLRPSVAIIALDHPSLAAAGKVLYAKQILERLKKLGQASWARRYRGFSEFLIFGSIPSECIIRHVKLADLINLSDRCDDVRNLLHLHLFKPGLRALAVSKEIATNRMTLNASTGTAIARFALLFGLGGTHNLSHISAFCARVIDGWSITESTLHETDAAAALAFAATFQSSLHSKKALAEAFLLGVQEGIATLNYFAKRRRTA